MPEAAAEVPENKCTGRHVCVDIEPYDPEPLQRRPIFVARSVVKTFEHAASVVELCELAVQGLKTISGYDRVMAYRFWADGHGEVIAEARESSLKSPLGLHYPASDIPAQARRLYLRQRVGAIAGFQLRAGAFTHRSSAR